MHVQYDKNLTIQRILWKEEELQSKYFVDVITYFIYIYFLFIM